MNAHARNWHNGAAFASLALLTLALTSIPGSSQQPQDADPVADAARKAREQKKKHAPPPKKVYTDDDAHHLTFGGLPASYNATTPCGTGEAVQNPDAQINDRAAT